MGQIRWMPRFCVTEVVAKPHTGGPRSVAAASKWADGHQFPAITDATERVPPVLGGDFATTSNRIGFPIGIADLCVGLRRNGARPSKIVRSRISSRNTKPTRPCRLGGMAGAFFEHPAVRDWWPTVWRRRYRCRILQIQKVTCLVETRSCAHIRRGTRGAPPGVLLATSLLVSRAWVLKGPLT